MFRPLLALLLTGCVTELPKVADPCATWKQPGIYKMKLEVDDKTRTSWVYMPPSAGPRDVVFALHGAVSNGRDTAEFSEFIGVAKSRGFVAVFPEGTNPLFGRRAWNAGDCCLNADENARDESDIQFMETLLDRLEKEACVDRVLVTGFSNGAMLTHRWACESDRVDVAVPIGGTPAWRTCPGEPFPIRHYHGTDDTIVPVDGGGIGDFPPLHDAMSIWFERNQCSAEPPQRVTEGKTTCEVYDCAAPTEICLIDGWPHTWPGGILKGETGGLNATTASYDFFIEHAPARETGANTP